VPVLSDMNSVHTTQTYFFKIHVSHLRLGLSFWISRQHPIGIPLLPMRDTCPVHLIYLDFIILINIVGKYKL
jgi:hypothetical protein